MAQMNEQIKTPEKELHKMEITNLSNAESKTLVMRMLRELTEYIYKIKKTPQRTKSEGKEAGIQINDLEHQEEINSTK